MVSTASSEGQGRDSFGKPLQQFEPGVDFPGEPTPSAWWFIFRRGKLLVKERDTGTGEVNLPNLHEANELGLEPLSRHYMGRLDGVDCIAAEVDEQAETPAGYVFQPLRGLYG